MASQRLVTPVGELKWVFITGQGKKDLNDNDRYVASICFANDDPKLESLKAQVDAFWEENKPKGRKMKSNGLRPETVKNEAGEYEETGNTLLTMWTGITFPDGTPKVIKTMNSKGLEVSLGSKKIGNGSRGVLSGVMSIYDNGPAACGVTIYLNAIQLTKFVPYEDDAGFTEVDDEEGGFTGEELNEAGLQPVSETSTPDQGSAPADSLPKVKL